MTKFDILSINDDCPISYSKAEYTNTIDYKQSLNELLEIVAGDKPELVFQCNTINAVTIVLNDNTEISLHQYNRKNKLTRFFKKRFLKIYTDKCILLIPLKRKLYIKEHIWQSSANQNILDDADLIWTNNDAIADINGYEKCQKLLTNAISMVPKLFQGIPEYADRYKNIKLNAIEYCNSLKMNLNDHKYQGYLPAAGELNIILQYIDLINYILKYLNLSEINLFEPGLWTCSESSTRFSYCFMYNVPVQNMPKITSLPVLPLFKQIN